MSTPHNPDESIIITLDQYAEACYQHYIIGYGTAIMNLQKLHKQILSEESKAALKQQMVDRFVAEQNKIAQLPSATNEEEKKAE